MLIGNDIYFLLIFKADFQSREMRRVTNLTGFYSVSAAEQAVFFSPHGSLVGRSQLQLRHQPTSEDRTRQRHAFTSLYTHLANALPVLTHKRSAGSGFVAAQMQTENLNRRVLETQKGSLKRSWDVWIFFY